MSNLLVQNIKHTNGTTALTVDSSGRVLQPSVPAFRVGLTSDQNVTTTGSQITIEFNEGTSSESDNCFTQGGFSWSSGVVTVPVTGVYHFDLLARVDSVGSGYIVFSIAKNNDFSGNKRMFSIEGDPATDYQTITASGVFKLAASDNVRCAIYSSTDSNLNVTTSTTFSGHLVG